MSDSPGSPVSVLLLDERVDAAAFREELADAVERPVTVLAPPSVEGVTTALDGIDFDCAVVPHGGAGPGGRELLDRIRGRDRSLPVVVRGDGSSGRAPTDLVGAGPVTYVPGGDVPGEAPAAVETVAGATARGSADDVSTADPTIEDRFDVLFDDSLAPAVAVEVVDGTPLVRATNAAFRDTFCADRSALGRPLPEVVGVPAAATDSLERRVADEATVDESVTRRTAEGDRTFRTRVAPIADGGRVVVYRSEEENDQIHQFEALIHNSSDILSILNRDGTFEYVSPAAESILGYAPEQLEGELTLDYIHPDDRQEVAEEFFGDPVQWDGDRRKQIFRFQNPEGDWRTVESIAQSKMSDPRIEGVVVNSRDVTEREKRKTELERYETMVETIPLGLFALDDEARMVWANDRFLELMGRPEEEVVGTQFLEFIREGLFEEELVEDYLASVRQLLSSDPGSETVMEEVHYYPPPEADAARDEYVFDVHFGLLPLVDGEFQGTVNAFRDITERKRYQRKIEEKNERLQQFASFVSHDLRNPLNVAQGYVELAKTGDTEAAEEIEVSLNRMERLIQELLTMAREGQDVDQLSRSDLETLARRSWETVETGGASLVVDTSGPVLGEESTLQQVFENLFRNAVEHGGRNVTVTVGDLEDGDGFFVADDGPGIPEGDRERVLELGYTTNEAGTGFGLGIVSRIADAHDWTVSVTESEDGGARFEFRGVDRPDGE